MYFAVTWGGTVGQVRRDLHYGTVSLVLVLSPFTDCNGGSEEDHRVYDSRLKKPNVIHNASDYASAILEPNLMRTIPERKRTGVICTSRNTCANAPVARRENGSCGDSADERNSD